MSSKAQAAREREREKAESREGLVRSNEILMYDNEGRK